MRGDQYDERREMRGLAAALQLAGHYGATRVHVHESTLAIINSFQWPHQGNDLDPPDELWL